MSRTRTLLALFAAQLLATGALAQSETGGIEFGRASSGEVHAIVKSPRQFSGSLSLRQSTGGEGYGGTLGGELLDDRLWFFGAASVLPAMQHFTTPALPSMDAKATAQPVDWTAVTASFNRMQQPLLVPNGMALPSSFLSLRSTSMLSESTMLSFSYSSSATGDR